MTDQSQAPETINLVILQADKDGQLACFTHPIVQQFSSEYLSIIAKALSAVSNGMQGDAMAKALMEEQTAKQAVEEPKE